MVLDFVLNVDIFFWWGDFFEYFYFFILDYSFGNGLVFVKMCDLIKGIIIINIL